MSREKQDAAGVAIEAMDEFGFAFSFLAIAPQHIIEIFFEASTALHREAGGFIDSYDIVIFIDYEFFDLVFDARGFFFSCGFGRGHDLRWHAYPLPGFETCRRIGAFSCDADLAGAQQFLQLAMGKRREMALKPAVETDARFVVGDGVSLEFCHALS